jgi:hypothetical protein
MHPPKYQSNNPQTHLPTCPPKQEASVQSYDLSDYTAAGYHNFDNVMVM